MINKNLKKTTSPEEQEVRVEWQVWREQVVSQIVAVGDVDVAACVAALHELVPHVQLVSY